MVKRKVLFLPRTGLAQDILSPRARAVLEGLGEVTWNPMDRDYTADELAALLPGADAVVTSWGSPNFTPELLDVADQLKIVGHAAGSVKNRMPEEGYKRGIVVLSAAAVIADSVAEYTLWAMLSMQRDLYSYDQLMKQEKGWKRADTGFAQELYYKKVGIVSASMVGRRVIKLLAPFKCDVLLFDPYVTASECMALGVKKVSLEVMFSTCDIVSLHAPVTPETKELITRAHFDALHDGALFINTARAWVVDSPAMMDTLRTKRIRAVLDVFDKEPLEPDSELRTMDNVFITPHVSGHTTESRSRLVEEIARDMERFFAGKQLQYAVSWDRLRIMA
ncbi:MAG: hydroxyacid dehydrogenase [Anaerolineae bacterium]|nr:hydroxyacid dehydrogenase [Anaerolineae bacterium]